MDSNTAWNGHNLDQSASGQDSFQQFMGMDGLDGNASFNFDHFLATQQTSHGHSAQQSPMQHMDATMAKNNHNNHMMGIQKGNMMMEHMPMNGQGNFMNTGNSEMNMAAHGDMGRVNSLVDIDAQIQRLQMQRQLQQQQSLLEQQQNYYVHHRVIPPTPNSMEMQSRESQRNSLQQATHYDASEMQMRQHDVSIWRQVNRVLVLIHSDGIHSTRNTCGHSFGHEL